MNALSFYTANGKFHSFNGTYKMAIIYKLIGLNKVARDLSN